MDGGEERAGWPHVVVLASAGTGKTHELTGRLIALLAGGAEPSTIVAATFARRAAWEILERTFRRLSEASSCDRRAEELSSQVEGEPGMGRPMGREGWERVCAAAARGLPGLSVGTIDSVMLRAAACFGEEIGLAPGWRICDEWTDARLRGEALRAALRGAPLSAWEELLGVVRSAESRSSASAALLRAVDEAWSAYGRTRGRADGWRAVGAGGTEPTEDEAARAAGVLEGAALPLTKSGEPHRTVEKARGVLLELVRERSWEKACERCETFLSSAGSGQFAKATLPDGLREAVRAVRGLVAAGVTARVRARNLAVLEILERFDAAYTALKRRRGVYRFDDVPGLLSAAGLEGRLEELYYRLDARVQHLLLDEFQDTSVEQFEFFRPVLEEILAHGDRSRTVLCVGDVKQSLYGWRSAEPELLTRLPDRWPGRWREKALTRNRRSAAVVLDAVDRVFGGVEGLVRSVSDDESAARGARAWGAGYARHEAARELPGAVRVVVGPEREKGNGAAAWERTMAELAARRAREAWEREPGASVAVLVRRNSMVWPVVRALRALGVPAAAEGAGRPADAPASSAVLAALRAADHPGDTVSAFHVASSPLGAVAGLEQDGAVESWRAGLATLRRRLAEEGCGAWLASAVRELGGILTAEERDRLWSMVGVARSGSLVDPLRPGAMARFMAWSDAGAGSGGAVRVMTVHKAKGLEFDAVILAELWTEWAGRADAVVAMRDPQDVSRVSLATVMPGERVRAMCPRLAEAYGWWVARRVGEELSVLYVGMTRARRLLECVVPGDAGDGLCAASVLTRALGVAVDGPEGGAMGRVAWEHPASVEAWWAGVEGKRSEVRRAHERARWPAAGTGPGSPLRVRHRAATGVAAERAARGEGPAPSAERGQERDGFNGSGGRERGVLWHAWLALVEWSEAGVPAMDELLAAASREGVEEDAARREAVAFASALRGGLGAALSRSRYAGWGGVAAVLVKREWPFAARLEEEGLVSGRLDRVVVGVGPGGGAAWAEVLDWKTGQGADEAVRREEAAQVMLYREVVAGMLGVGLEAVRGTLVRVSGSGATEERVG